MCSYSTSNKFLRPQCLFPTLTAGFPDDFGLRVIKRLICLPVGQLSSKVAMDKRGYRKVETEQQLAVILVVG